MGASSVLDQVRVGVEGEASAAGDGGVDLDEGGEAAVGGRLVEGRPEALRRLELGRVGRQVDEPDPVGDGEPRLGAPAGVVEREDNGAIPTGAGLAGEQGEEREERLEERLGYPVGEVPEGGLAGGG